MTPLTWSSIACSDPAAKCTARPVPCTWVTPWPVNTPGPVGRRVAYKRGDVPGRVRGIHIASVVACRGGQEPQSTGKAPCHLYIVGIITALITIPVVAGPLHTNLHSTKRSSTPTSCPQPRVPRPSRPCSCSDCDAPLSCGHFHATSQSCATTPPRKQLVVAATRWCQL